MKKSRRTKRSRGTNSKHLFIIVLCIGVVVIILACLTRFGLLNIKGKTSITTSAMLTDAINISELSTAEFKYRGIADIFSDENRTKVSCRVCYNAVVKAGIDMQKVQFDINQENKTEFNTAILF